MKVVLKKYRVVRDSYAGFEVQTWRWWLPFWLCIPLNTHRSIDKAKESIDRKLRKIKQRADKSVYFSKSFSFDVKI